MPVYEIDEHDGIVFFSMGYNVGPRSDVYALGTILYACLCGHAPFRAESAAATMHVVIHTTPPPMRHLREDIAKDLETICAKCLEKEPACRYASANLYRWQQATWGYGKLAQACEALGDVERASWAKERLSELKMKLEDR